MALPLISLAPRRASRLVALASGKGGVGKTVCTANLAMHLAQRHRVLTVDLDLGCGNLNTSLGVRDVTNSINDFLGSRVPSLSPLKTATAQDGLELISCSYSPLGTSDLAASQKDRLIEHLRTDDADYVFMDLGAGVGDDVLDLFAAADVRVLVTGPESLALHNAFVFVKSLVYRIIARSLEQVGLPKRTRENIVRQLYDSGDQEIGRTIERIRMRDSVTANTIRTVLSNIQLHLIMNKVQESAEERFVTNLQQLVRKYAEVELNYLGSIPYDDNVKKSLNEIVPFALEYELSPANAAFRTVAHRLEHALSETIAPDLDEAELERPGMSRKLRVLLSDLWTAATSSFRDKGVPVETDFREYDLKIRKLTEELSDTKRMHDKEKKGWLEEKEEISRRFEELMARQDEPPPTEDSAATDSLRESIRQRDEFIDQLQSAAQQGALETQRIIAAKDERIARLERLLVESELRIETLEEMLSRPAEPAVLDEITAAPEVESELPTGDEHQVSSPPAPETVREQILADLARHSSNRITIVQMEEGGLEVARFAAEIADVLGDSDWVINSVASSFKDSQFNGLKIIHDDTRNAVEGARILGHALVEAGIEYIMQRAPFPTEFERIRLVVGRNGNRSQRTLKTLLASAALMRQA